MPGPIVKGTALPVLVSDNPTYISETRQFIREVEYRGPEDAIRGLQQQFIDAGYTYRITNDGPVYSIFISIVDQVVDEQLDRWEVFTESTEKSLFELDEVVAVAEAYDNGLQDGDQTYRIIIENAVTSKNSSLDVGTGLSSVLVRHLRAGVTGWQLDLVGLRRTRSIQAGTVANYQVTLDTGQLIYSTAKLNLPPAVAFAVPSTPPEISDLFLWGWRKRSQRVEIIGQNIEQTVELLFAPWSLLAYEEAVTNLAW